jgi:hypothetical protein
VTPLSKSFFLSLWSIAQVEFFLDFVPYLGYCLGAKIGTRRKFMQTLTQKKFSITSEHKQFIENYNHWGFTDQSSIVRAAMDLFIKEFQRKQRKSLMAQKASELVADYIQDKELTAFSSLDAEDFL